MRKHPRHGVQLCRRIRLQREAVFFAERQNRRLVLLHVNRRNRPDGQRRYAVFMQKRAEAAFQMRRVRAALAAHAHSQRSRPQKERHGERWADFPFRNRYADRPARQRGGGNRLNRRLVLNHAVVFHRPAVNSGDAAHVRRGRQHGLCARFLRQQQREIVCAADVAGEDGNDVPPRFVHDEHGGVGRLISAERGNGAHRNAACADEQQCVRIGEGFPRPLHDGHAARHGEAELFLPALSFFGEGNGANPHGFSASRQAWVNVGS